jgi:hypothetical protein
MKILKTAAIVVAAVTLAVVTAGVASGASAALTFSYLAAGTIGALGVSAGAATAILGGIVALGAVSALSAIAPQPSQGGSQTKWKADPYAGVPYVMGRTLVSGNIVGKRGSGGKNEYEYFVTILSGAGPIHALEATFANRTTVTFDGGDPQTGSANGTYHDYILQAWQKGNCPEPVAMPVFSGTFPGWTAASRLSGMAATLVTMRYHSTGKNPFTTEVQMSWILQGVLVYDPRLDSTYPGGSGPCRAFDESTYVYSENPHLHGLTWALGRYQNGKRACGIGAKVAEIDIASFVEGANLDDARGWKVGGQVVTRPDAPWSSLKSILQAGGATPSLVGGLIICINRYPRVSLATITGADIVGDCSFAGTQPRRSRINGIIPMYRSEEHDWEMVTAAGVIISDYVALDGDERTKEVQYSLVQDVTQATQLATYDVCDAREAGPGTVPLGPWWLNYRIGDCVTFNPEDDFLIKCLITGRDLDAQTGTVTYTLISETDGKHALALGATGVAPPTASIVYDTSVDTPDAASWTITGVTLSSNGGSVPAIEVDGTVDNESASIVLFDIRLHASGQADDAGWEALSIDDPTVTRKVITAVTPNTAYDVGIRYVVRGITSDRLILGPAIAGVLQTAGDIAQLIVKSKPDSSFAPTAAIDGGGTTATVTIPAHNRIYQDETVAVNAGTIGGLALNTYYALFYDDLSRTGGAVTYMASTDPDDALPATTAHPGRTYLGYITTPASGSTGGSTGGGGSGGGGVGRQPIVHDV